MVVTRLFSNNFFNKKNCFCSTCSTATNIVHSKVAKNEKDAQISQVFVQQSDGCKEKCKKCKRTLR